MSRSLASVGFCAMLFACTAGGEHRPPIVWSGDVLEYRAQRDDEEFVCGGTFEYLDAAASRLFRTFELPPGAVSFTFAPSDIEQFCRANTVGCTRGSSAHSVEAVHIHEIVHAVRAGHSSYLGLEEGAAEAFGDDWALFGSPRGDTRETLSAWQTAAGSSSDYPRLGHFVSYLAADYGDATLAAILNGAPYGSNFEQMAEQFRVATGDNLDSAIDRYEVDYPDCEAPRFRDDTLECSGSALLLPETAGAHVTEEFRVACAETETIGPRRGEIWRNLVVVAPQSGLYDVEVLALGNDDASVRFSECGRSCFANDELFIETSGIATRVCLKGSKYLLRLSSDSSTDTDFYFDFTFVGPSECE